MMDADHAAIRALIGDWLAATRDGNIARVLELITPDVVFLTPGQPPMQGRDAFGASLRQVLAGHAIDADSEIVEIAVQGDMAYSITRLSVRMRARDSGAVIQRAGNTLSILRKDGNGRWYMHRDANLLGPV